MGKSCARSLSRFAKVPVIVASAHVTADAQKEALDSGADIFLQKPLTMEELKKAVSQFVPLT
jgi:DNA-binding response OmpR family regulator